MEPLVSLIVPVYNAAHLLPNTIGNMILQSIANRGEGAFEVIFIDDASTDDSPAILMNLAAQYTDRVRLHLSKKNKGQGAARNIGLDMAKGEYIGFVDCDDMIDATYCEKLYDVAGQVVPSTDSGTAGGPQADIIECYYYDEREKQFVCTVPAECRGVLDDAKRCRLVAEGGFVWGKLIRRAFLEEHHMRFREGDILEDVDFSTVLYAAAVSIAVVEEPLYIYKDNAGSSTKKKGGQIFFETILRGVKEMYDRMRALPNYEAVRDGAEAVYYVYFAKATEEVEGLKATGFLDRETERQLFRTISGVFKEVIRGRIDENPYALRQLDEETLRKLKQRFER